MICTRSRVVAGVVKIEFKLMQVTNHRTCRRPFKQFTSALPWINRRGSLQRSKRKHWNSGLAKGNMLRINGMSLRSTSSKMMTVTKFHPLSRPQAHQLQSESATKAKAKLPSHRQTSEERGLLLGQILQQSPTVGPKRRNIDTSSSLVGILWLVQFFHSLLMLRTSGNLSYKTTKESIVVHFASCPDPPTVRLLTPKLNKSGATTPKSKGCAFLEFTKPHSLQHALKLHHSLLDGRRINVELTSGGGGSSEKRKETIKTRNRALDEERERVSNAATHDEQVPPFDICFVLLNKCADKKFQKCQGRKPRHYQRRSKTLDDIWRRNQ